MAAKPGLADVVLIALGCGVLLAGANHLTADRIRENESAALHGELRALIGRGSELPESLSDLDRVPTSWRLCDGGLLVHATAAGYGGPIRLLYLFEDAGSTAATSRPHIRGPQITGVRLLAHQETPGITDFLNNPGGWLNHFEGRTTLDIDEVDTVTGATITVEAIRAHLATTLADPAATLGTPTVESCAS